MLLWLSLFILWPENGKSFPALWFGTWLVGLNQNLTISQRKPPVIPSAVSRPSQPSRNFPSNYTTCHFSLWWILTKITNTSQNRTCLFMTWLCPCFFLCLKCSFTQPLHTCSSTASFLLQCLGREGPFQRGRVWTKVEMLKCGSNVIFLKTYTMCLSPPSNRNNPLFHISVLALIPAFYYLRPCLSCYMEFLMLSSLLDSKRPMNQTHQLTFRV